MIEFTHILKLLCNFLFYLINIIDANVDGHLKTFDVSDDLSMQLKPDYNPATKSIGIGFAFNINKTPQRKLLPAF